MRKFLTVCFVVVCCSAGAAGATPGDADVVIYGGTPAGIAAALAAADDGRTVLLIEPTNRLGGLVTSGLSHTDFRTFESLTGAYLDFARAVAAHYEKTYGMRSPQAEGNFRGTHAEPKVNLAVFERMLAQRPRVTVLRSHTLKSVQTKAAGGKRQVVGITAEHQGKAVEVEGRVFIDATYEGDLMAAAKVPYRVGREGKAEYGESLAADKPDGQLQAYNFRIVLTTDPANRVPVPVPAGYDREDFVGVLPLFKEQKLMRVFASAGRAIYKSQIPTLPNGKSDINDMSRGLVRLSLPRENLGWPEGDAATRRAIFESHVRWNFGLLHFLQNDKAVPKAFQDEANRWGLCRDEFPETNHLPPQLYVRESRRMVGSSVFTQRDCEHADNDARASLRTDAIAAGDYGPNCHGTDHEGTRFGGKHTGEFYQPCPPYQIPYGVLVPKDVTNLLVPGAMSSSHVGFCALRYEPIWMSLGQAAGLAASLSVAGTVAVQEVAVAKLQSKLHEAGSATVYVSDVPPGHADFAAVQWWGTAGGFRGLHPAPEKPGQRGKPIVEQYFEAFPGHAAELELALTDDLAKKWGAIAARLQVPAEKLPAVGGQVTRGDWLRAAYSSRPQP